METEYARIIREYGNNGLSNLEIVMIAPSGGGEWRLTWKDMDFSLDQRERVFASWTFKQALESFDWSGKNRYFKIQGINPSYLKSRIRRFLRKGYDG